MPDDVQVGGGYVKLGAQLGDLESALGRSETLTRNTLKTMGDMAQEFGRNFGAAIGVGIPSMTPMGISGMVGPGVESLKGLEQLQIMAERLGIDYGKATGQVDAMYEKLHKVAPATKQDTAEMLALGLSVGLVNENLADTAAYYERITALSQMSFARKSPVDVARDLARQREAGTAEFGDYGLFGSYEGAFTQVGWDELMRRADEQSRKPDPKAKDPRQQVERLKKDVTQKMQEIGSNLAQGVLGITEGDLSVAGVLDYAHELDYESKISAALTANPAQEALERKQRMGNLPDRMNAIRNRGAAAVTPPPNTWGQSLADEVIGWKNNLTNPYAPGEDSAMGPLVMESQSTSLNRNQDFLKPDSADLIGVFREMARVTKELLEQRRREQIW